MEAVAATLARYVTGRAVALHYVSVVTHGCERRHVQRRVEVWLGSHSSREPLDFVDKLTGEHRR